MRSNRETSNGRSLGNLSKAIEEFHSTADQLELFLLVYRFLKERPQTSYPELADQIRDHLGLDIPHHRLAAAVTQLEDQLDLRLVMRTPRSKANSLGIDAERLYDRVYRLIDDIRRLKGPEQVVRIGAADLLINFVIPSVAAEFRRWGGEKVQDVAFEVSECREAEEIVNKVGSGEIDFALIWAYEDKLNRLEQLGTPRSVKVERLFEVAGVGFEQPTELKFDILMICSPTHRFVAQAKKLARPGSPWRVHLDELRDEQLVVLPPRRQPILKHITMPPGSKGRLIEVDSFSQVIAHVRGLIKDSVGLVPFIYTEINELRRKGQIFCARIDGLPDGADMVSIGCVSQGGIAQLNPRAREFLACSEGILRRIGDLKDLGPLELEEFPGEIGDFRRYQHCYFVMQHEKVFGVPGWFEGELSWELAGGDPVREEHHYESRLRGHLGGTFITITSRKWSFAVNGWLRENVKAKDDRLFQFVGEGATPNQKNTIICTFNTRIVYKGFDALVGVWSGRDDHGLATVAPMVLVQKSFGRDLSMLRSIINKTSYRFLPNAEDWGIASE